MALLLSQCLKQKKMHELWKMLTRSLSISFLVVSQLPGSEGCRSWGCINVEMHVKRNSWVTAGLNMVAWSSLWVRKFVTCCLLEPGRHCWWKNCSATALSLGTEHLQTSVVGQCCNPDRCLGLLYSECGFASYCLDWVGSDTASFACLSSVSFHLRGEIFIDWLQTVLFIFFIGAHCRADAASLLLSGVQNLGLIWSQHKQENFCLSCSSSRGLSFTNSHWWEMVPFHHCASPTFMNLLFIYLSIIPSNDLPKEGD